MVMTESRWLHCKTHWEGSGDCHSNFDAIGNNAAIAVYRREGAKGGVRQRMQRGVSGSTTTCTSQHVCVSLAAALCGEHMEAV